LASEGYSLASLRQIAPYLVAIAHELRDCPDLTVREEEIQTVTERATRLHSEFSVFGNVEQFRELFAREAKRWLIFLGRIQPAKRKPLPFEKLFDHYVEWMKNERGPAPSTIEGRRWKLKWFPNWFSDKHRPIRTISLADVDEYQSVCKAKRFSRVTLNDHACAIRSFLKHAGTQGWCSPSLAAGIRGPVIYQHENLPAGPSWDEVKRLLKALDTNDPLDIRDLEALADKSASLATHENQRECFGAFPSPIIALGGAARNLSSCIHGCHSCRWLPLIMRSIMGAWLS
jgi:integrase/recombinase XerD